MSELDLVKPQLSILNPDQIDRVHRYTLDILSTTGVRVDSKRAREVLRRSDGVLWTGEDRVRFAPELVDWAVEVAPAVIDIYDRLGNPAFSLGNDRTRFGIGVTSLFYEDPLLDIVTPFNRRHMEVLTQLGNRLPLYDVISTVGIVQDVPPEVADLYATLEMVANTTKPLVILISDENAFPDIIELLEHLHGDLGTRPFVMPYFNPVTPLIINEGTGDKMIESIEHGLPLIYSNYSLGGMTAPITPGGILAMLNAELLAGLVISQLAQEGTPIILGMLPAYLDMKTMVNFYDPQSFVIDLACAEMMAHYQLPHCGTSGSGTGWGPDLLAADSYWMNQLTSCIGKVGLAPFVGDTLTSKAFSPVNAVYVHEVIDQALRFAAGFDLGAGSVGLSEIDHVGPGGSFLTAPQTVKRFRTAYYTSPIWPRWSMEKWRDEGSPHADDLLRRYTVDLLDSLYAPDDHDDLIERGEALIQKLVAQR